VARPESPSVFVLRMCFCCRGGGDPDKPVLSARTLFIIILHYIAAADSDSSDSPSPCSRECIVMIVRPSTGGQFTLDFIIFYFFSSEKDYGSRRAIVCAVGGGMMWDISPSWTFFFFY
jgi:hypothetical protein